MPRFAANLSMMFTEVPFLDRFDAARAAGFAGVEYLFPYDFEAEAIAAKLRENSLENILFNMPPGNWAAGERVIASLPGRRFSPSRGIGRRLGRIVGLGCVAHVIDALREERVPFGSHQPPPPINLLGVEVAGLLALELDPAAVGIVIAGGTRQRRADAEHEK
jgi:hydroxypyruvate isomerase